MNDSKILIVGANGQLGKALKSKYSGARSVVSTELDITDLNAMNNFNWSNVKVILNAAAYTNVDGAETPEGRIASWKVNAVGVRNLAAIAREHDLTLVHISSDYVFDGIAESHDENEPFTPLNVYGQSKAAGDLVASLVDKHYILRTTWVIGEGKNFVRTMLSLANRDISPTVVDDQIGRLTFTDELVKIIDHLLSTDADHGTYNATNSGEPASWADVTREIFRLAGRDDLTVTGTTTDEYYAGKDGIAPRPLNSIMALDKLAASGYTSKDWHEALQEYVEKELA